MIEGFEPRPGEIVIRKDVNSVFIGTDLELRLREYAIRRLVLAGFFTNFCVETTTRMAGNLGYDTYLVHDACAACNRIAHGGKDYDPQRVHDLAVATLHGEFCTAIDTEQAIAPDSRSPTRARSGAGQRIAFSEPLARRPPARDKFPYPERCLLFKLCKSWIRPA